MEKMARNIVWQPYTITKEHRQQLNKHKSFVVWFTGLPASGKSTLSNALECKLHEMGICTYLLDGDNIRQGLCRDLDFTKEGRRENIRRVAEYNQNKALEQILNYLKDEGKLTGNIKKAGFMD